MKINQQSNYVRPDLLQSAKATFLTEMLSIRDIEKYLINILDFDDSPDLTEMHPRDRNNVSVHVMFLFDHIEDNSTQEVKNKFKDTIKIVQHMPGVISARIIAIGPKSIVPLHLDDMQRPAYDLNNWYSVLIPINVSDASLIGIEIENNIYTHENDQAIIFDTQVPHSGWNKTDQWWISLKLYIEKDYFK